MVKKYGIRDNTPPKPKASKGKPMKKSLHSKMISGLSKIAKEGINMNSRNPKIKKLK